MLCGKNSHWLDIYANTTIRLTTRGMREDRGKIDVVCELVGQHISAH